MPKFMVQEGYRQTREFAIPKARRPSAAIPRWTWSWSARASPGGT